MREVIIVQARMGSTRLPGKSLKKICGKPLIWHVVNRLFGVGLPVILALANETPGAADIACAVAVRNIAPAVAVNDLVGRYTQVVKLYGADLIIRVPADNPCVDPVEINRLREVYHKNPAPWNWLTTNLDRDVLGNGYPGGLGAEIYDRRFLEWMNANLTEPRHREHPHLWAFENQYIRTIQAPEEIRSPDLRFDVNTAADLSYIRTIYNSLYPTNSNFRTKDILKYLGRDNDRLRN